MVLRLKSGARPQEIDAARARVAGADAQIATLQQALEDATVKAPVAGIVTQKLADVGEILAPRAPIVTLVDLDHAWANIYVDEPLIPRVRLGAQATIFTDAGGAGLKGTVTFISPKAEFTPRNVQTREDRDRLVYGVEIQIPNPERKLRPGMPVEVTIEGTGRAAGGEVRFGCLVSGLRTAGATLTGLEVNGNDILECCAAVLAIGHSARGQPPALSIG